jgi:hypothetical protein
VGAILLSAGAGACSQHAAEPQLIYPAGTVPPTIKARFHEPTADGSSQALPLIDHTLQPTDYILLPLSVIPPAATPIPVFAPRTPIPHGGLFDGLNDVWEAAGIPEEWWWEFAIIADCESRWTPSQVGDGGLAKGLLQIHWYPQADWRGWFEAALAAGYVSESDRDLWADPVVNAKVGHFIRVNRGRFGGFGGWTCADLRGIA